MSAKRNSDQHKLGVFYTPKVVATHALKEALATLVEGKSLSQILRIRLLDPSFGDGVFLETALEFLLDHIQKMDKNFSFKKWEKQIQKHCLFGVDINTSLIHVRPSIKNSNLKIGKNSVLSAWSPMSANGSTRSLSILNCPTTGSISVEHDQILQIWNKSWKGNSSSKLSIFGPLFDTWLTIKLGRASLQDLNSQDWFGFVKKYLETNGKINSGIERKVKQATEKYRFFHWDLEFADTSFDLICGNPPWEVIENSDNACNEFLPQEAVYSSFVGQQYDLPTGRRIELAAAFTNLTFQILDGQGLLSFLLPSSINYAKTYEKIRIVSLTNATHINRFDNSSGVFEGLDKRCDFISLNINFGKQKKLMLSSSMYFEEIFNQQDIKLSSNSNLKLLSGPESVIPNFKDKVSTHVIEKILTECRPIDELNVKYETWNGLNSTTDKHLVVDRKSESANILPVATGQNINILSTVCREGKEFSKSIPKSLLRGRGHSDLFDCNIWEVERIGWRKIARADDTRTLIVSPIPKGVVNMESLWSIVFSDHDFQLWCEFIWSSLPFDAVARTIVNSNVSKFVLLGLPIPTLDKGTLKKYKTIREVLGKVRYGSVPYFELMKELNNLAFDFFDLNIFEQRILISSYFNPSHPLIIQTTGTSTQLVKAAA